ncbi:MAG: hypothetical protein WAQ28_12520 [Bacteroidia bacterium]|jgi:hypothetical protein
MLKQAGIMALLCICLNLFSQENNSTANNHTLYGLQAETYLHPLNSNTAYTFKKGEASYNQAPAAIPLPAWGWIGITDWLTAEIDFLPLVGGLFTKPHLPVPSFNFRFRVAQQDKWKPALAYETMFQYLYKEFNQTNSPTFAIYRHKASWYNKLNASWRIKSNFYIHLSGGCTFAQYLKLVNTDSLHSQEKIFRNKLSPDASLGLDYRLRWISFHVNTSYGTTFNYIDNVPRKFEVMYGVRIAPFYKNRFGILKSFRIEWEGFYNSFPDINAKVYVPVFIPYFYWQWKFK